MIGPFRVHRCNLRQLLSIGGALLLTFVSRSAYANQPDSAPSPQNVPTPQNTSAPQSPAKKVTAADFTSLHFSKVFPSNFVPLYPGAIANSGFTNSTKGPPAATTTLSTNDEPEKVLKWYSDYFSGDHWQVKMPFGPDFASLTKSGKPAFLNAQKDNREVSVISMKSKRTAKTIVTISWSMRPNKP
jgi:hypothetical protein